MKQSAMATCAQYAAHSSDKVISKFSSNLITGLTYAQVPEHALHYGLNVVSSREKSWWRAVFQEIYSPFTVLFLVVALLLFVVREFIDSGIVMLFVTLNILMEFYQGYRVSKTIQLLNKHLQISVWVRRQNKEFQIASKQVVAGDIVIMYPGDRVVADMRLLQTENFFVDESMLTGESAPVYKNADEIWPDERHTVESLPNIAYAGTTVTVGKAVGIIFAVGDSTQMGSIAYLSSKDVEKTSALVTGTMELGTFIVKIVSITLLIIFIINICFKTDGPSIFEFLIFTITLALSVIPEALPLVVSFCLSRGVAILAKRHVVVKRLSALEDLGSMQILCADKTGTLTENKMTIADKYPQDSDLLVRYGALASFRKKEKIKTMAHGFDAAFLDALSQEDVSWCEQYHQEAEIPFDSIRLRHLMLVRKDSAYELVMCGAPEMVALICSQASLTGFPAYKEWIIDSGNKGNRILAIARKLVVQRPHDLVSQEERPDFEFLGMVAFADPLKKTAREAISKAHRLSVTIKILSGDSKEVCATVASQAGLINTINEVVTGVEFAQANVEKKRELALNGLVFARMLPEQKYEVVSILRTMYRVGYVGDGINDAPALKVADVSLAVSGAASVARETADILLLRTNLLCVIEGIQEGRTIVTNTLKYVCTTLAANFGNFYAIAIASLFANYLPMQPTHILLVNLLTDFPMIAIATDSVSSLQIQKPRKFSIKMILPLALTLGCVSTLFDMIFFLIFHNFSAKVVQTGWFVESILTELVLVFSIRSSQPFFKHPWPSWQIVVFACLIAVIAIVLPSLSIGQSLFGFIQLTYMQFALIGGLVIGYFLATELIKLAYYSRMVQSYLRSYEDL